MTKSATRFLFPFLLITAVAAAACASPSHGGTLASHDKATTRISSIDPVAPHSGVATGNLILEGGPPNGGNPRPLSGTVAFIQHARVVATATVGPDGRFSQNLTPGVYLVQACTTRIQTINPNGSHVNACGPTIRAAIEANQTTTVQMPPFIVP